MGINGNGKNEKLETPSLAPLWKAISNHSSARKQKEIKRENNRNEGKKGKLRMERCKLMERGKRMESSKRLLLLPPVRVLGATKQPYVALRPPAGCPIQYRAPPQLTGERI